ncbi:potassium voltage-gated channel subfamily G member 4 [Sorex fumeus]|uniref:potassium voltage-gated channel subfamily G member 4 n=1 Tax=Sorex fumeus TaxID=62283 RepID=UPI0024ADCCDF|nr:potassium voltage-gated channel subfamily G member 4 [Sorex fumeus]
MAPADPPLSGEKALGEALQSEGTWGAAETSEGRGGGVGRAAACRLSSSLQAAGLDLCRGQSYPGVALRPGALTAAGGGPASRGSDESRHAGGRTGAGERGVPSRAMPAPPGDGAGAGAGAPRPAPRSPPRAPSPRAPDPPAKGRYYGRARRVSGPDARADPREELLVNVGGRRYLLPWSALDAAPRCRLARLRGCRSPAERARLCDDFDERTGEFFFDRSPRAFGMVVSFLAAGRLALLQDACALSLRDELAYWGLEPALLDGCCRRRLRAKLDELAELGRADALRGRTEPGGTPAPPSRWGRCMSRLREMVENPQSGLPGKVFACLSVLFVATTAVSLCVSTMPDLRAEEDKGECSRKCYSLFVVETVCVAWFSLEFCLRFVQARDKCRFFQRPLNVIDILAISPYYAALAVPAERAAGAGLALERVGLALRVLRALRVLYVMRLARHSLGLRTLGLTVRRCARELGLLLLFLCVAVTLFSPLVYVAERESGRALEFTSIPAAYWWAVISMTTVGYGDMVPRSVPGQVVALSSILSGILIMAFPATSIFHTFSHSYLELKREQEQLQARLRHLQSAAERERAAPAPRGAQGKPLNEPSGKRAPRK